MISPEQEANKAAGNDLAPLNPMLPEFLVDPYPFYHRYRTSDPVHWGRSTTPGSPGCWYLFRHGDVEALLKDARVSRELHNLVPGAKRAQKSQANNPIFSILSKFIIFRDPPDHTRLRRLSIKAFTPRMVEKLRPRIEVIANALLDQVQKQGTMDLIADFAFPLPASVIAEIIGIPATFQEQLKAWSKALLKIVDFQPAEANHKQHFMAVMDFWRCMKYLANERRKEPQDDLLSALLSAEEQGQKLTEEEVLASCMMILWAGHETTENLIGNGMLALLRHPEQMAMWRDHPALAQTAVEELLRFDSPSQMVGRGVLEDLEIGGKRISAGQLVVGVIGAANRDPEKFVEPDRLDLTRVENEHLSFGEGIHYCIGASLARAEAQIAFTTLLQRLPNLKLVHETPAWSPNVAIRGLKTLPLAFSH